MKHPRLNAMLVFPPFPTFRTLYLVQCKTAVQKYSAHVDVPKFIRRLEDKFCFNSSEPWNTKSRANLPRRPPSSEGSQHAAALHRRCLQSLHKSMSQLFSNTTCLACLMHTPEKPFECGHALCDQCIRTSGARSRTEKHVYELENCILCGQQNSSKTFRFVPPTAGLRLLSIDGGGVRGVIPLQILESLDDELKKHFGCSIHEAFDFVVGTSAGTCIVCESPLSALLTCTFRRPDNPWRIPYVLGCSRFQEAI